MSKTETRSEEWEVEVCDDCGHEEWLHYKEPEEYVGWVWEGCIVVKPRGRVLRAVKPDGPPNPYLRCPCMEFK